MSNYKNILIDAPLEGTEYERLFKLKGNPLLTKADKVTLIHVYNSSQENQIPLDVDAKDCDQVEYVIKERLEALHQIIDPEEKIKWETKVLFNKDSKNACLFFAREQKADLVIVPTRGLDKGHIHNESFAQYMLESNAGDLLVLKS